MRQGTHEGEAFHYRGRHRHPHSQGPMRTWRSPVPSESGGEEARRCICLRKWVGVPKKMKNEIFRKNSATAPKGGR